LLDLAGRVAQVAEHYRPGRARRLAGGHHLAVADRPALPLGHDLGVPDPLHAVRALLHHPAAADRDVRVAAELEALGVPVLEGEEVEPADLVRAVVRAVPGADAP